MTAWEAVSLRKDFAALIVVFNDTDCSEHVTCFTQIIQFVKTIIIVLVSSCGTEACWCFETVFVNVLHGMNK